MLDVNCFRFVLCVLMLASGLKRGYSLTLGEDVGHSKYLENTPLNREKRFSLWNKIKKKKMFQKYVGDGLSTETEKLWGVYIRKMHYDFIKNEDENVEFPCNNKVTGAILRQYPKSTYRWSLNEDPVAMDTSRMFLFKGTFSIKNVKSEDAGVYVCIIEYRKQDFKTIGIYSLTVKTEKVTYPVRETDDLELSCNSKIFSDNFPEVTTEWYFNDTLYKSQSNNASDILKIEKVETKAQGVWSCIVKDPKTKRVWHSAWYNIAITPPPPKYEQAYNLMMEHKLYTTVTVLTFILLVVIILGICVCTAQKAKTKNERNMGSMKDHVMSLQSSNLFGLNNLNLEMQGDTSSNYTSGTRSSARDTYSEFEVTTVDETARLVPSYYYY